MRIHFIAIGGSAMHNLALALHKKGFIVTGSDDEISEPSRSRLKVTGILPDKDGWFPEKITNDIDAVILGMHARADNPELVEAQKKGIRIFSYPEYLYEFSKNKTRVVIGGSHGKTTITAMILHVMKHCKKDFDFMVGAQLEGFDTMVRLTEDAPVIILEGDEYLASPVDRRPKFHLYHPNIALLSGIAWDHINVFPTFENYIEQFKVYINLIADGGTLIYCENDEEVKTICEAAQNSIKKIPYGIPNYIIENGETFLGTKDKGQVTGDKKLNTKHPDKSGFRYAQQNTKHKTQLLIFGEHNLMNLEGARKVCNELGIADDDFYAAISTFKGAARRLELVAKNSTTAIYKDFAHSPSKLRATIDAVKQQYSGRKIIACMELHTFSSLNENFLEQYNGCMDKADEAYIYFNPHTIAHKKLKPITAKQVKSAFARDDIYIYTNSNELQNTLQKKNYTNTVLLMMSSGNFDGMDLKRIVPGILDN